MSDRFIRAEIIRTFNLLIAAGGVTELRALDAVMRGGKPYPATISGYFDCPEKLANAVETIVSAKGIYIIPNALDPALLTRAVNRMRVVNKGDPLTTDDGIVRRRWLKLDFDAVRPTGISSTDAQHDAARQRAARVREYLRAKGWPEPILADSGNGWHLLYRIDLIPGDEGLVERCLAALSHQFSDEAVKVDTAVGNPARIWKLYGTLACKGDATAERPHRMARLVDVPEPVAIVAPELLDALATEAPATRPASNKAGKKENSKGGKSKGKFDLVAWLATHIPDAGEPKPWKDGGLIWSLPTCPFSTAHTDGAYVAQLPSGAISAGCHHESCTWGWHDLRERCDPKDKRETEDGEGKLTHAQLALELAHERFRFSQTLKREGFAVVKEGPNIALLLDSSDFKDQLSSAVYRQCGIVLSASTIADVLSVLRGEARETKPEMTYLRVGRHGEGRRPRPWNSRRRGRGRGIGRLGGPGDLSHCVHEDGAHERPSHAQAGRQPSGTPPADQPHGGDVAAAPGVVGGGVHPRHSPPDPAGRGHPRVGQDDRGHFRSVVRRSVAGHRAFAAARPGQLGGHAGGLLGERHRQCLRHP